MNSPLQIGVTGGIGSGKSTICKIFNILGISSYDSDSRAKWLNNNDQRVIAEIQKVFGPMIYINGQLDTKALSKVVFGDKIQLEKLNSIVHPAVSKDFEYWASARKNSAYIIKEAALIFETGINNKLDAVITVYSPLELRIKRIQNRDHQRSKEQILSIINQQMEDEKKVALADFVIYNNEKSLIIPQILSIHQALSTKVLSNKNNKFNGRSFSHS